MKGKTSIKIKLDFKIYIRYIFKGCYNIRLERDDIKEGKFSCILGFAWKVSEWYCVCS